MDDERSMVVLGAVVGAALGALAGYLFLTERGRRLRQDLVPQVDAFVRDLRHVQETIARARLMVSEGLGADGAAPRERRSGTEQTVPL